MAGETILVVDDNELNLTLARVVLAAAGFEVLTAVDAESALATVRSARPRLILMDVQLPRVDGLQLTRTLKADAAFDPTARSSTCCPRCSTSQPRASRRKS